MTGASAPSLVPQEVGDMADLGSVRPLLTHPLNLMTVFPFACKAGFSHIEPVN